MITVIAHYRAKPEGVPAALAALHDLAATVRRLEPDCSGITVLQSSDDPTRITCIERWPSREHYQGPHLHQPHVQAFVWGAGAFLAGPPEVSFWCAGDVQDPADPPMIDPPTVVSAPVASRASTAILRAIHANITTLDVDAVVSAANETLLGGGGVDGAIHRAAGPQLLAECRGLNGCRPGEAKITKGYRLRARFVIHTVGPIWQGGDEGEARILASCYRRSIEVAADNGVRTLAFPCVSTGVYGYPPAEAAAIAVATVREALKANPSITEVVFCCFSADDLAHYQALLGGASANGATPAR